jgi:hypothetical protein
VACRGLIDDAGRPRRSVKRRRAGVLLAAGLVGVLAFGPAAGGRAAGEGPPVALGPTGSGAVLRAFDSGRRELCIRVEVPLEAGEDCDRVPSSPDVAVVGAVARRGATAAGGAVSPSVADVEIEYMDGARKRGPALDGAYRGRHAGSVRFFLVERADGARPWLARLIGADGELLAALMLGDPPAVRGPRRLAGGRFPTGRARWELRALVRRVVAPVPGTLDRVEDEPCLVVRYRGASELRCVAAEPGLWRAVDSNELRLDRGGDFDAPGRYLVWGFASARAVQLRVVLGDGRRARVPVRRMPDELASTARWFAWVTPRRAAVRRVVALDARRRVLARSETPLAPPTVRGIFGLGLTAPLVPAAPPRLALGPLRRDPDARLLLRSVGAYLCAEIDHPDTDEPSCGLPPRLAIQAVIAARATRRGYTVGGLVSPAVAAVRLGSGSGRQVSVPTQPAGAPAGPWGDSARVFLGTVPYRRRPEFEVPVALLDSGGDVLARGSEHLSLDATGPEESEYHPVVQGRLPGGGRYALSAERGFGDCFALTRPGTRPAPGGIGCPFDDLVLLVTCRPRAAAVLAPARGRRGLSAVTAAGGILPGRVVQAGTRRIWFVLAPPEAGLREVRWLDGRGRTRRVRLGRVPPAARQCGYVVDR